MELETVYKEIPKNLPYRDKRITMSRAIYKVSAFIDNHASLSKILLN